MSSKRLSKWSAVFCIFLLVGNGCHGYSHGAPDSACSDLTPRHASNDPQKSPAPYSVTPIQTAVEPGGAVTVRIASSVPNNNFRGFMLHAVEVKGANTNGHSLGTFREDAEKAKVLTCTPGLHNMLTHHNSRNKSSVDLTWQAPNDFQGDVTFLCTFVRDYSTFWVSVPSSTSVRVGRSANVNPTTYSRNPAADVPSSTPTYSVAPPGTVTTKIVTNPWSFSTPAAPLAVSHAPSIYQGCADTKGCFGLPDPSCVAKTSCTSLVTYALKGARFEFELWANNAAPNSYVAVAFSFDNRMGDDSVTECTLTNGRVHTYMSYNEGKSNRRIGEGESFGLTGTESRFADGQLYCRFTRQSNTTFNGKSFDLSKGDLFLLLARGSASLEAIQYHSGGQRISTAQPVKLAETGSVGANRNILVKLHGAFMVTAWLFSASLGILFARYFRLTWVGKQLMGKDLWFVFHRILMAAVWALTITAVVLIFVDVGGWTSIPTERNPHAVIGIIVTVMAFIQPLMAYFRPHPGTRNRFIFNWAHWLVGNSAHILAIVCIFLAVDLDKAAIPYWVNWLLVSYVAIHAISHLILSLGQCCYHADGSRKSSVMAMRDLAPHQSNHGNNQFYSTQQADKKEDAHGSGFRKIVLALYCLLVGSFSAAVIGVIVTGPWSKQ